MNSFHVVFQSVITAETLVALLTGFRRGNFLVNFSQVFSMQSRRSEGHVAVFALQASLDALMNVSDVMLEGETLHLLSTNVWGKRVMYFLIDSAIH